MVEIQFSHDLDANFMRKTATGALWLQYYVDKNSPGTILVLAKQDDFAHIIRPLIRVFVYSII